MTTGFLTDSGDGRLVDVDDLLVRRELFADGRVWCWGAGSLGQLGDNTSSNRSSPVTTVAGGTNWKQVAGGSDHTAAVKTDGRLWCWGYNSFGQIGDGTSPNAFSSRISPVTTAGGGTNWKQVACGFAHTAAIKTDGTLWSWGNNGLGQLGDNTIVNKSSPVSTVGGQGSWKQVAIGYSNTAAIKTDGTLWTWGNGASGQLGDNTSSNRSSPVTTVAGGTNWKQVAAGKEHVGAIKTDGTLWFWGANSFGQLGDNTSSSRSSPVTTIAAGNNWKQVGLGFNADHTTALKTDGTLWTWGRNNSGQLGDSSTSSRSSPVTTFGGQGSWKQVSCGSAATVAIKTDGTLWCWGGNSVGQLADGSTTSNRSSPATTVAGGTNWKQVACGFNHTVAVTDLSLGSL